MSFTSEFEQLYKEKKERDAQKAQSMIGLFNAYSQELAAKQSQNASGGIEVFKAPGAFDDGYQFGDITKVILGTAGDAGVNFGKGFTGFSEGIADWIGHNVIYPVARSTGQNENDLKWYRRYLNKSTTQKWFDGVDAALDENSVLGHTSDAAMQGIGQYIPVVAAERLLPGSGKVLRGLSTMGSAQSEAYAGGATDGEALAHGVASAGAELLFESLFGGMGKAVNAVGFNKGLLGVDDLLAKRLASFVSKQGGKNIVEALVKGGFEGLEEVGTGFAQAVSKKLTYMSEEEFGKILKDENLFEQFIVGALVSDIAQAGDVRIANKTGTDLVTGFTKNEQAVIDQEVKNRIKQEQKGGKKLSGKEKSAIYEQVVKDMERGYISTETIESVLGKDVSALAQNDRLGESYREQTRKNEKFQADVSQYPEAQRKTVQNAIDSGILNNTNRSHEFVDLIAKISADKGISFDFADNAKLKESGFALDGVLVNGFVNENGVTINIQSAKALNRVVGHEITHVLEGTELYDALQSAVTEYAKTKKEYSRRLKELTELYEGKNANVEQELVADLVGDYLFTDADFIKHLSTEHRSLFQKIYDEIKYLCKVVTAGTKEARQLEKVKKAFADAYRAETKNPTADGGTRYSIGNIVGVSGKNYGVGVSLDSTLLSNLTEDERIDMVKEYVKELGGSVFTAYDNNHNAVDVHIVESNKKFKNKSGKRVPVTKDLTSYLKSEVKQEAIALIDELVLASSYEGKEPATHPHDWLDDNGTNDWDLWKTYIQDKQNTVWEASLRIANSTNGEKILYDIFPIKMVEGAGTSATTTTNNNIAPNKQSVNNQNSLSKKDFSIAPPVGADVHGKDIGYDIAPPVPERVLRKNSVDTIQENGVHQANEPNADRNSQKVERNSRIEEMLSEYMDDVAVRYESAQIMGDSRYDGSLDIAMHAIYDAIEEYRKRNGVSEDIKKRLGYGHKSVRDVADDIVDNWKRNYDGSNFLHRKLDEFQPANRATSVSNKVTEAHLAVPNAELEKENTAMIDYDIAPPIPESVLRANKARPKVGDPAYAPIAEKYVKQANTDDRMQDVAAIVGDKDTYLSKKAMELYQELSGLSKGVRASKRLGYILDHGYDWKSIKTALLNIRDNPGQVVNENSAAESVAREMLGREYDELVQELSEQNETMDTYVTKMRNIQKELTNNERLRAESRADYDGEIERLQAEYDGKKNKTTKAANNLLRRIERLSRMRDNVDADYAKRISNLEERLAKIDAPEYRRAAQRKSKQAEYTSLMKELVGDTSTWVDKKMGLSYKVNTLRRNLRDVVRDASGKRDIARADAIYDELQGKYNHNEAELKRESRRIKAVFAELNLNHAEDTYAHMLGEFQYNPQSLLTEEVVKEFYEKNKGKIDTEKVDTAIAEARKTFDELIVRVNDRLKEQGMKEIPYRKGYFPHFHQPKQGLLARLLNWKTVDTEIPTSIAGLTETFNPERSWQSFNKERKTDNTDYSLAQGLDTYIHGALDWIYHIEDIQKRRALENYIRYIHSDEGIKARVDAIIDSEELDADEVQQQIDAVYAEANNPLNNFVTNLRAGTNTLANKKSEDDRKWEYDTNRKIYSVMTNLNNRINANMVVGSISSALTNFIPITQSWVEVSPVYSLKGMRDTIKATIRDDGVVNKSDFLTNRLLNEESLYKTSWDKISDKAAFMMEAIDNFTSQTVWRSKYLQNIAEGMSETQAIKNADQFAENVIAGRSRGNQPTIFDAKNPFTKIFTAFQLEVSNQYGYMFKDAPQDAATKGRLIKGYATAFLGAYVYNALYSSLVGRDAAFDPISIFEDLFRDLGLFGDDEEEEPADIILNLTDNILDEVPFVGGLMGGGRIPISSALPYSGEYGGLKGFLTDVSEGDGESLVKEMLKPLYYLALPMGGGQIKKTTEGVGMYLGDHPVAGSYTDSGALRFPVGTTAGDVVQAAVFGQYANENARDYFDNGRSPLKTRQIHAFMCTDMSIQDYWTYREGLSAIEADKDEDGKTINGSKKEKVVKYIENLDISDDAKHILFKYEYPSDDTYNYEIIDYLNSRTDISYTEIKAILEELGFTVDTKGNITWD